MANTDSSSVTTALAGEIDGAVEWLKRSALPIWIDVGHDAETGGFFERINLDGTANRNDNRRARVQPRQVYCYAVGGDKDAPASWHAATTTAFAWFEQVYRRSDGFYGSLASPTGTLLDDSFDLYNQAFALFAMAQMAQKFPHRAREMEDKARALLAGLKVTYAHQLGGFEEGDPVKLPLCSNPHMHLFEASLAWEAIAGDAAPWIALADEIARLALTRFIDAESGALREFFDHDWRPYPGDKGRIVEPGHQFEWAWLLARWSASRDNAAAMKAATRLFDIGARHGLCPSREVAIMGLFDDFTISDPMARLWPQTEWLKAAILLAKVGSPADREGYLAQALQAIRALKKFLATNVIGLWFDKMRPDGSFIEEPAPASSFYHIVCAILEADTVLRRMQIL